MLALLVALLAAVTSGFSWWVYRRTARQAVQSV